MLCSALALSATAFTLSHAPLPFRSNSRRAQHTVPSMFYERDDPIDDIWLQRLRRAHVLGDPPASLTEKEEPADPHRADTFPHPRAASELLDDCPTLLASDDQVLLEETNEYYTVRVKQRSVDIVDVDVTFEENNMLVVSGETTRQDGRSSVEASFVNRICLPADADTDVLTTRFGEGEVVVVLAKAMPKASSRRMEAEGLAAESPRVARWLKANGYLVDRDQDRAVERSPAHTPMHVLDGV